MAIKNERFYDAVYSFKNYETEAARLEALIAQHCLIEPDSLLDIACGTGSHLTFLSNRYQIEGLDINPEYLEIARERLPGITFYQGDMTSFHLEKQYSFITCLFGSIGYVKTEEALRKTLVNISRHILPGGLVIVEPFLKPGDYQAGKLYSVFVDEPDLKIARMSISRKEGNLAKFDFNFLVGTPEGVEYFVEQHELGLFTEEEYSRAFTDSGLEVRLVATGLNGRGVFIGLKPLSS